MLFYINPFNVCVFLAYIDPGTGSMLFATLIGLVGIAGYFIKGLWLKLRFVLSGGKKVDTSDEVIPFVIFSDDKRYWPVFEPVCRELDKLGFDTVYMTSSSDDPALQSQYKHLRAEFIGQGNRAFVRMNFLKATMVLSTTPGLDVYQWKRSRDVKYYIHIPHMPAELTTYRMFGLDYYDAILASGQCQIDDVRALEKLRSLPEKECTIVGIPYLDEEAKRLKNISPVEHELTVLVAPSWGKNSLLNRFGNKLIDQLLSTNYHVIIRPHPQSFTSEKALIDRLMKDFPDLEWNRDIDNFDVLNRSDILISDFSGVIFDFALVFNKPVICAYKDFDDSQFDAWWLDTPIWSATAIPRLGPILSDDNLSQLKELIDTSLKEQKYKESISGIRDEIWANRGISAELVAKYIVEKHQTLVSDSTESVNSKPSDNHEEKPGSIDASNQLSDSEVDNDPAHRLKERYRLSIVVIIVAIILSAVVLIMQYSTKLSIEKERELEDLKSMRSANSLAIGTLENGQVNEDTEYWLVNFNHQFMSISPVSSSAKPQPYGKGTSFVGKASKDFYKDGDTPFEYDESQDYTEKIIKVTIDPDTKDIKVEWVDSH